MRSRFIVVLLLIALVAVASCRKSSNAPPPAAPAPASGADPLNTTAGGATPPPQTKHFKGSIGSTLDLQMKLVRNGDQLVGSYFYQKVGKIIGLRGTVDKDGNLSLDEFDQGGKQTGMFKGLWTVDKEDGLITLAGNWSFRNPARNTAPNPFAASQRNTAIPQPFPSTRKTFVAPILPLP